MKLSNNAIKFLMAQYRAIYKNAYFKGIASAVILTAGLAAGQAQAADLDKDAFGKLEANAEVDSTTASNKLAISGSASNSNKFTITVTSGDAHKIDGIATDATTVSAENATLIINDKDANKANTKVTVAPNATAGAVNVNFGKIDIVNGIVALAKNTATTTITANTINIGRDASGSVAASSGADLTFDSGNTVGKAITTYGKGTTINLQQGGTIKFGGVTDAAGAMVVNADNLSVTEGKIVIGSGATSHADKAKINIVSGSVTMGTVSVGSGAELSFDVSGKKDAKGKDIAGTLLFGAGATVDNQGTIKLTGDGNYTFEDGLTITSTNKGAISVIGTASAKPTLSASATTIKNAVAQGQVTVASGNLTITDDTVNVADLSIGAAAAGKLSFGKDGVLQGNNIIIDDETTGATDMTVKATGKLTLGKTSGAAVNITALAGMEAKDVEFISHDGSTAFTLKKGLTLSSTVESEGVKSAASGSITGAVDVSGGIVTVAAGNYTANNDIKVTSGSLTVSSALASGKAGENVASKLTVGKDATVTVVNNADTGITVSGTGAVLDLSAAKSLVLADASASQANTAITANNGSVIATGKQVTDFAKTVGGKAGSFGIKGKGQLVITDNLEIGQAALKTADLSSAVSDAAGIVFHNADTSGALTVSGTLTITGANSATAVGKDNKVTAGSLVLKSDQDENKLGAGTFTALNSVSSLKDNAQNKLTLSGSAFNLGTAASEGGEIAANITLGVNGASSGTMTVAGGTWTGAGSNIDVVSGNLTVGGQFANDTDTDPVSAVLSVNKLTGTAGTVNVEKNASLKLKELSNTAATITIKDGATASTEQIKTVTGGKINVAGSMTVAGATITEGDEPTKAKNGVDLATGKLVVVSDKGTLTFGQTATDSIVIGDGSTAMDTKGFANNSIDLQQGGTVKFAFDEEDTFNAEKLAQLRKIFGVTAPGALTAGVIDLGNATIDGVSDLITEGSVKWDDIKRYADVYSDVVNKELADVKVTDIKSGNDVRGNFGALVQAKGNGDEQIGIETSSSLSGADKNNGFFASDATGKNAVGLNVKNGTMTLNNAGKVADISLAGSSTLKLNGQQGTIEVLGKVKGGNENKLLVTTGTANVTGSTTVGYADIGANTVFKTESFKASNSDKDNTLAGNVSVTKAAEFAGDTTVAGNLSVGEAATFKNALTLTGNASAASLSVDGLLTTAKGSTLNVTSGAFTATKDVEAEGAIKVTGEGAKATFKQIATLKADGNEFVDVSFGDGAYIAGNTRILGTVNTTKGLDIDGGATASIKTLTLGQSNVANGGSTQAIYVGTVGKDAVPGVSAAIPESNGILSVETLNLQGGKIVADPGYESPSTIVAVKNLKGAVAETATTDGHAGSLDGKVYALQNSIVALGTNNVDAVKGTFAKYFDAADGSLDQDGAVQAVAYVANSIKLGSGDQIVVDPARNENTYNAAGVTYTGDLDLSKNAVLAVDFEAVKDDKTAVTFDGRAENAGATVKVAADGSSKVLLAGNGFSPYQSIRLFGIQGNTGVTAPGSVTLTGNTALDVATINGLFSYQLTNDNISSSFNLSFNEHEARKLFGNLSEPVRETLITYAMTDINYYETGDKVTYIPVMGDAVGFKVAAKGNTLVDAEGKTVDLAAQRNASLRQHLIDTGIINGADNTVNANALRDSEGNLFYTPDNELLNRVLDGKIAGVDAETAARLADFGGVAQAALRAGNTTSDAIAARMGVGVNGTVTFAANGQGSGMWVTPVYKTADSDSFGADGVDYGTDMNLYGVAVGADVSVMENVSAGVMFNVGSGDADGQGLGSNVKNDFDYYGFGAYMGYTMGAASVVADVSWTTVDNSVEGQTGLGTLAASIDSSALSLGVTGKYAMDFGGVNVTPHAGLRFTRIDQDDYTVGNGTDVFAQYSSNSMNVFSVPVGVTVEKEYTFDAWSVKPAFDLTLTGNFGDDETSGTVDWEGISNLSTDIKSEFVDTFTYSTAIGVAAQTGNFGMGLGVNYTGASNVKEFGVNANVRYVF